MYTKKSSLPLLKTTDDIIQRAKEISSQEKPHRVAVAAAHDSAVIDAVIKAQHEQIADAVLIGNARSIICGFQ